MKVGDIVELKSNNEINDNPKMVINFIDGLTENCTCIWFIDGILHSGIFAQEVLNNIDEQKVTVKINQRPKHFIELSQIPEHSIDSLKSSFGIIKDVYDE